MEDEAALLFGKKKKRRPRKNRPKPTAEAETGVSENGSPEAEAQPEDDYSYDQLLLRAFELRGQTQQEEKKIRLPPVKIFRFGRKTLWSNFPIICKSLNRDPNHLMTFVMVELGMGANFDGNGRLIIRGSFYPRQIQSLQKKYLDEYVTCKTCGSNDTILKKENRLQFIECASQVCGSTRSVTPLTKGYVHNMRRRSNK